jgi:hypothetical protein
MTGAGLLPTRAASSCSISGRYPLAPASSCAMIPSARARSRPAISSKSCGDTFAIARSNSSSLIDRSVSAFSRSRSWRVRSLSGWRSKSACGATSGASMR